MKSGVVWKSCHYFLSLVINKLLWLRRAVLVMWTKTISKLLSGMDLNFVSEHGKILN